MATSQVADLHWLHGWGRTAPSRAHVVAPHSVEDLQELMSAAGERGLIARGLGRSYGDVAQNAGGHVIDMTRLTRVLEFNTETGLVKVEAGCSLDALVDTALGHGWFLPVSPGTGWVTVGGAIACDVHGKNHHSDGAFGAHVGSLVLLTTAGDLIELDREHHPRAFAATIGGLGLTGLVVQATLQLAPVETALMHVVTERATDIDDLLSRMAATDHLYRYSVAWVDGRAGGRQFGRSVLLRGDHAAVDELPEKDRARPLNRPRRHRVAVPRRASAAPLLNGRALTAYNDLRFRRAREGRSLETIDSFFYPLDGIANWNRLYGRRGLIQYQFVVPFGREGALRTLLDRLRAARPVLIVLKQLGPEAGPLSFPMVGWTVAIDFAATPMLGRLLDEADELVADAGGRIYLAKDARLRPDLFERMTPRLAEWRESRDALDPLGRMQCDLARRLRLVGP